MATIFNLASGYVLSSATTSTSSTINVSATATQYIIVTGMGNTANDSTSKYTSLIVGPGGSGVFYNPSSTVSGTVLIMTFEQVDINSL